MRRSKFFDMTKDWAIGDVILRYILGLIMITYGLIKILEIQFELPLHVYEVPLKDLDGVTLTWAFLGYSSWFVVLIGLFEFIPATLILFRSTKLIGAILLLPSTSIIFLVNNAYEFLPHMRTFTATLLAINFIILVIHFRVLNKIIKNLMFRNFKGIKIEFMVNLIFVFIILCYIIYNQ